MNEEIVTKKSFLQIKSIRTSSNAFSMKLREDDVIIALDGEMVHKSYEELSKDCLLYTSPSPRDCLLSRMPSSA